MKGPTGGLDLKQLIILAVILVTSGASGQAFRLLATAPPAPSLPAVSSSPSQAAGPTYRDIQRLERTVERQDERIQRLELQVTVLQRTRS